MGKERKHIERFEVCESELGMVCKGETKIILENKIS